MKKNEKSYLNIPATGHFVPIHFTGKTIEHQPIYVQSSNNTSIQSISNVELGISTLPPQLKKATIFKEITKPLFSIPAVCDGGMEVTFRKKDVVVKEQNNKVVLTGIQDTKTALWIIPIVEQNLNHMQQLRAMTDVTTTK